MKKLITIMIVTGLLSLVLFQCTPPGTFVRTTPEIYPEKPSDYPIQVFAQSHPQHPFREIGLIETRGSSFSEVIHRMKYFARLLGADAIYKILYHPNGQGRSVGIVFQ